jgi:hypothetical protein
MPRFLISTRGTGVPPVMNNHRRDGHATRRLRERPSSRLFMVRRSTGNLAASSSRNSLFASPCSKSPVKYPIPENWIRSETNPRSPAKPTHKRGRILDGLSGGEKRFGAMEAGEQRWIEKHFLPL